MKIQIRSSCKVSRKACIAAHHPAQRQQQIFIRYVKKLTSQSTPLQVTEQEWCAVLTAITCMHVIEDDRESRLFVTKAMQALYQLT
jgi:hypothetical protein